MMAKTTLKQQFLMRKSTISMAIFHCYVSSPNTQTYRKPNGVKTCQDSVVWVEAPGLQPRFCRRFPPPEKIDSASSGFLIGKES